MDLKFKQPVEVFVATCSSLHAGGKCLGVFASEDVAYQHAAAHGRTLQLKYHDTITGKQDQDLSNAWHLKQYKGFVELFTAYFSDRREYIDLVITTHQIMDS